MKLSRRRDNRGPLGLSVWSLLACGLSFWSLALIWQAGRTGHGFWQAVCRRDTKGCVVQLMRFHPPRRILLAALTQFWVAETKISILFYYTKL